MFQSKMNIFVQDSGTNFWKSINNKIPALNLPVTIAAAHFFLTPIEPTV